MHACIIDDEGIIYVSKISYNVMLYEDVNDLCVLQVLKKNF